MKILCIYHSIDLDGWMSAAIVRYHFEMKKITSNFEVIDIEADTNIDKYNDDDTTFLFMYGWDYNPDNLPYLYGFDKLIVVDSSLPTQITETVAEAYKSQFIWIDHHVSAIKRLQNVGYSIPNLPDLNTISGLRNTKYAACELTWNYFFPNNDMPMIVELLGGYDSYRFKNDPNYTYANQPNNISVEDTLLFQYGARFYMKNHEDCYHFLKKFLSDEDYYVENLRNSIVDKGAVVYTYIKNDTLKKLKDGYPVDVVSYNKTYKFLAVNASNFNPTTFGLEKYYENDYDGVLSYYYLDGRWRVTISSTTIDVSKIADYYGGGGHMGRSGFTLNPNEINKILN